MQTSFIEGLNWSATAANGTARAWQHLSATHAVTVLLGARRSSESEIDASVRVDRSSSIVSRDSGSQVRHLATGTRLTFE
jgi:hypothetical protein